PPPLPPLCPYTSSSDLGALDLVYDRLRRHVVDEADRVRGGRGPHDVVVQRQVLVAALVGERAGQRGLPALARALEQHHRRVRQGDRKSTRLNSSHVKNS